MSANPPIALRSTVWEWGLVAVLSVNLGWTTLCLGGVRPETVVVTSAMNALLVSLYAVSRVWGGEEQSRCSHAAGWLLVPFLAYATVSVIWVTPVPWKGWLDWLGWAQMIAVFWVVLNGVRSASARKMLLGVLVLLGVVAVLLACYQRFVNPEWLMLGRTQAKQYAQRSSGPFGVPNSLAAFLLLPLPLLGALACRRGAAVVQRIVAGYLTAVFAFGLGLTISRGAWLALGVVLVAWPAFAMRGSLWRRARWTAAAAGAVLAIGATLYFSVPAVRARLDALRTESGERSRPFLWRGALQIFQESPVLGGGAASYGTLFEKYRPEKYQNEPHWAHNEYLNTLSDYGAFGFVMLFGAAAVIVWRCRSGRPEPSDDFVDDPLVGQALAVGLAGFALQLVVDIHFKIAALTMSFAVIGALWVQRRWPANQRAVAQARPWRLVTPLIALAVLGVWLMWLLPFIRGEALRYGARQAIDRMALKGLPIAHWPPVLAPARDALRRAVVLAPGNGAAWADLAYATALSAHLEPGNTRQLGREAEQAALHALACSRAPLEFWVRHGVALDMQGRWTEAGASFAEAIGRGPARPATWFNYAFHLSLRPGDPQVAIAAVDTCLRLDPGNKEGQALRQRLAMRARTQ